MGDIGASQTEFRESTSAFFAISLKTLISKAVSLTGFGSVEETGIYNSIGAFGVVWQTITNYSTESLKGSYKKRTLNCPRLPTDAQRQISFEQFMCLISIQIVH